MLRWIKVFRLNYRYAVHWHKPLLLLRLALRFWDVYVCRKTPFRRIDVALHYRCNLTCAHCFARGLGSSRPPLTLNDYRRVADEAMSLGGVNFCFLGGEPTVDLSELIAVINQFSPKKNLISITTNATLLDRKGIRRLRAAGVDIFSISLDSALADEHDAFRGRQGVFAQAMRCIDWAQEAGIQVTLISTVSKHNIRSAGFRQLIELAERRSLALYLSLATPIGNWSDNDEVLLDEADMAMIRELEKKHMYMRTDFLTNWREVGCGAVKEVLYMTPYGDLFPCSLLPISLGNVRDDSLVTIRNRGLRICDFDTYSLRCKACEDHAFVKDIGRKVHQGTWMTWKDYSSK